MPKANTAETETAVEEVLTPVQMCERMHAKGMTEDAIIEALAKSAGLSIMKAVGAYKKFQKDAGLVMSKEERTTKITDTINPFVDAKKKTIELEKAVAAVASELDISDSSAKGHVRRYCKGAGIEMPVRSTLSEDDLAPYIDTVVKGKEAGEKKVDTLAALMKNFKLDDKTAKRVYTRVCKLKGLTAARVAIDNGPIIAFLKKNGKVLVTKEKFVEALTTNFKDLAPSTARGLWKMYQFAIDFGTAK